MVLRTDDTEIDELYEVERPGMHRLYRFFYDPDRNEFFLQLLADFLTSVRAVDWQDACVRYYDSTRKRYIFRNMAGKAILIVEKAMLKSMYCKTDPETKPTMFRQATLPAT
ncbi:MAG: hypothetical protein PHG23_00665 [Candidatus Pacebacteria bacterium]|nr:hypothetical protein [Candidatus Paceibacterota bacterium]